MSASRLRTKKPLQKGCNKTLSSFDVGIATANLKSPELPISIQILDRVKVFDRNASDVCQGYLERQLVARGVRLTQQRRTVLAVIEAAPQCRNVGVIHRRARGVDLGIHRVTVYRTLALLKRHGMLTQPGGSAPCQGENNCPNAAACNQIQMKCLLCGKMVAFQSGMFGDLTRCVEKDCRFRVASATLDISGYCQSCRT
jgi:Fur family ferric uptake transcriptional regulator